MMPEVTLSVTSTIDSIVSTTSYAYNGADQLTQMTYPSGRTVDYARNTLGQVDAVTSTQGTTDAVANSMSYQPFGPMSGMVYGNNLVQSKTYDLDYRLTQLITINGSIHQDLGYTYDAVNNITDIANAVDNTRSQTLGYDLLNRLTDATSNYGDIDYTYDAIGNRLSETVDTVAETYSYDVNSHHLQQTQNGVTTSYSYDANGNTISNTGRDFSYGDNNRLKDASTGGSNLATYTYNGRGERVKKDSNSVTYYYYDQGGQLITELDTSGNIITEYIYIDGQPVSIVTNGNLNFIHNDHLGTPQQITDGTQAIVWKADYKSFGEATVTTEAITNNLRFPGQYYDAEINLHYNYFRYYNPKLGRYITSDPIGLNAGPNTHGYVDQNPIRFIDPLGLRASYCQRPLGDFSGENGSGPPVFNHQFICVTLPDGSIRCDSQNNPDDDENGPFVPTPGVPSLPERDNEENAQCENIDDDEDRCFEDCVLNQFAQPRPNYAIGPLGTDCQEYSDNTLNICRQQCSE
jgi:RHS repeat-associated protein